MSSSFFISVIYLRQLFHLNFLFYHRNLHFFTKTAISPLVTKFSCFNLAVTFSADNSLNSRVVICLLQSGILFSTIVRAVVVAKLVILGISFLVSFIWALRTAVAARLVILDISFLTSFILALRVILVDNLVISGIISSISLTLPLYIYFF